MHAALYITVCCVILILIHHYSDWQLAEQLLKEMSAAGIPPSIYSYNGLINALSRAKLWQQAVAVLDTMMAAGVQANIVNYNSVLDACAKAKQWESALQVFQDITEKAGLDADLVSYNTGILSQLHACTCIHM
jgi:pentatricopeptide repeat domain-containing protein 1